MRILERAGLITRRRDPGGARRVRIEITDAGPAMCSEDRGRRDTWLCGAGNAALTSSEQAILDQAGELMRRLPNCRPDNREDGSSIAESL